MLTNEDVTDRSTELQEKRLLGSREEENSVRSSGGSWKGKRIQSKHHLRSLSKTKPKGSEAMISSPRTQMPSSKYTNISSTGHSHTRFQRG